MPRCPSCLQEVPDGRYCAACGKELGTSSQLPTRLESHSPATSSPGVDHGRFFPGMLLAGRYRIVAPLGKGGMGEVYRADDLKLGQPVALKFLPERVERDPERLDRFLAEVRIARQVAHPNVCRVYDVGDVDGHHYLSMEYVDGEDLGSLLRRIGRLPSDKGVQVARQISAGLAAAHDAGVLHRDLKPGNIMIDGRGRARITDFGLATVGREVGGKEARSGTPAYMAPEQLSGKSATYRSDLYALGLVMYELFTGKTPFPASSATDLLRLQTTSSPASPSSVVEGLDPAIERVIQHCLNPEPELRPSSAMAVASALPGGDPLAAALAAGETPSPELVAAAGDSGGLTPRVAAAALGAILAGLVIVGGLAGKVQMIRLVPLDKPPEVLAEKAREVLRSLGPADPPVDSLVAFQIHGAYYDFLEEARTPVSWPEMVGKAQPSMIRFGYRESPRPLKRLHVGGMGNWFQDPPATIPGMTEVTLDLQGRLLAFTRIPSPQGAPLDPAPEADWKPLLAATGFTPGEVDAVPPALTPTVYADRRVAWRGAYPGSPEIPIRIEAASLAGKPVSFRVLEPWDPESKPAEAASGFQVDVLFQELLFLGVVVAAGVVAFRNLRLGRGDRKGSLRFAIYLAATRLLWLLGAHHNFYDGEVELLITHLAWSFYRVGIVALFYLALEPYARRLWPRMLVSWMRLLDGRLRDPLVGRDALFGILFGVGLAAIGQLSTWLSWNTGLPAPPPEIGLWTLESLRGFRHALGALVAIHTQSVLSVFVPLMLLLALRLLSRRTWVAVVITTLMGFIVYYPGSGSIVLHAATFILPACLFWIALFRFGLLGFLLANTLGDMIRFMPLTFDLSAWYAAPSVLTLLVAAGLALFAFRASLAGRPALRAPAFGEAPAR